MIRPTLTSAAIAMVLALPASATADRLYLKSGGVLRGQWVNRAVHVNEYVLVTPWGRISVDAAKVDRVELADAAAAEYRERLAAVADTAAGHWELATWCRDHKLADQRETHLRRILELDPDHAEARQLLGYIYRGGRWITRSDHMREKGYVYFDGRWRMSQEVELTERRETLDKAEAKWLLRLRRLRESIDRDNARDMVRQFAELRDPLAVPALRQLLGEDRWQPAKLMYLGSLRNIDSPSAVKLLFDVSIRDPDREVRLTAMEHLTALDPPALAREYVKLLKSENNVEINRAAIALRYLEDPSTVNPLVDALITRHTVVLPGSPDTTTSTFSSDGGSGLSTGLGGKQISGTVRNSEVLETLSKLTGRSFGYDQPAWRAWLAATAQSQQR